MGVRRTSTKLHVWAEIVGAALAVRAGAAWVARLDGDGRAGLEAMD